MTTLQDIIDFRTENYDHPVNVESRDLSAAQLVRLVQGHITGASLLDVVVGSDWRGVDITEFVHPDDSDTFSDIDFFGCNFAGCNMTLFRQDNRFTDCDMTGAYVVVNGVKQPVQLNEEWCYIEN